MFDKFVGVAPSSGEATVTVAVVGVPPVGGTKEETALVAVVLATLSCLKRSAALVTLEFVSLRPQWRWKDVAT